MSNIYSTRNDDVMCFSHTTLQGITTSVNEQRKKLGQISIGITAVTRGFWALAILVTALSLITTFAGNNNRRSVIFVETLADIELN